MRRPGRRREVARGALLVLALGLGDQVAAANAVPSVPAYLARGEIVAAHYDTFRARFGRFSEALREQVTRDAPDLFPRLERVPPRVTPAGYQLLPQLIADSPAPTERPRAATASYSWPWTDRLVEQATLQLDRLEVELARIGSLDTTERRAAYDKLIGDYSQTSAHQRMIDAHIQYNRLWQAAIAEDQPGYDRQTMLQRAVLDRQAIRDALADALAATDDDAFRKALAQVPGVETARKREALVAELQEREATLSRTIDAATGMTRPAFIHVERPEPGVWIVHVPLATDIEDRDFVEAAKTAIENVWQLHEGGEEFRVRLEVTYIPAARLFGDATPPAPGEAIDVSAHCGRFPPGSGVLTTGATSIHVTGAAPCIVLGPHDLARHVLAHEFGHVLGFKDVYFRGYRDLGIDGYEVTEVMADPDDIMGAPGAGPVRRHHFERLTDSAR